MKQNVIKLMGIGYFQCKSESITRTTFGAVARNPSQQRITANHSNELVFRCKEQITVTSVETKTTSGRSYVASAVHQPYAYCWKLVMLNWRLASTESEMHIQQDSGLTHCWFELSLEARSDVDMPRCIWQSMQGLGDRLEVSDKKESKGMMIPTSASYCKNISLVVVMVPLHNL